MSTQVIINLPVADLPKSSAFFNALGFSHNPQSTDDTGACIVVSPPSFQSLAGRSVRQVAK